MTADRPEPLLVDPADVLDDPFWEPQVSALADRRDDAYPKFVAALRAADSEDDARVRAAAYSAAHEIFSRAVRPDFDE
jgi:hypothetical protein